jgi:hypothetical protein
MAFSLYFAGMPYQGKHLLIVTLVLIAGCRNPQPPKQNHPDTLSPDTAIARAPSPSRDTARLADSIRRAAADSVEQALAAMYDQYIEKYTTPCVFDTSFKVAAARFHLHVEHICTFDTGIVVPKTFVDKYKLDSFITHNFVTRIKLQKNGKKLLERTVSKKDFWLEYHPELAKYGVLSCPTVTIQAGMASLNYTICIPLTDVSTAAEVSIDEKGGVRFKVAD